MGIEAQATAAANHTAAASAPLTPELLTLIVETASSLTGYARRAVLHLLDEYIDEWLLELRPLPYIPNMVVEVASRKAWIPEIVEKLGAGVVIEAMRLALEAARANDCPSILPQILSIEEALIEASGIEPGEAIRSVMEGGDCRAHAALLAQLVAVKPPEGGEQ